MPREYAVTEPISEKSAFHLCLLHENSGGFIDLFRRNSGPNKLADTIENVARRATRLPHFLYFFCALDRNHSDALFSIRREISPNTASRSRLPSIRCKIDILA